MVPGPPTSLQLCGDTVLVMSLMSASSMVLLGPRFETPVPPPGGDPAELANGEAAEPGDPGEPGLPVAVPVGMPPWSDPGPVIGVGEPGVPGWFIDTIGIAGKGEPLGPAVKFSMGMTRSATL